MSLPNAVIFFASKKLHLTVELRIQCSIILFLFVILSCKKDSDSTNSLKPGRCRISCTLSGALSGSYSSDDNYSFSARNAVILALDAVNLNTASNIRQNISLQFPLSITTGTYNLSSTGAPTISFSYLKKSITANDDKSWNAGVGSNFTVVVTNVSYTELEGTFSGTATNTVDGTTITFSNGKFYTLF